MGNARDKLNALWFGIALFVAVMIGGVFNSFGATILIFLLVFGAMMVNRNVRIESRRRDRRR